MINRNNMKLNIFLSILLSMSALAGNAQDVLTVATDVRSDAMGGTGITQSASAFSIFNYGAAAALDESKGSAGYTFGALMPSAEVHVFNAVAGYFKPSANQSIALGVRHLSYPKTGLTDDEGNAAGSFRPNDLAIDLGHAFAISKHWAVSANVRYVSSSIAKGVSTGSAFGFDLGASARYGKLTGGITLSNIGTSMKFDGVKRNMPAEIKAGAAYTFINSDKHRLNGAAEMIYAFLPKHFTGFEAGVGAEYVYNDAIALRGGFHLGNSKDAIVNIPDNFGSSLSYGTAGVGFKFNKFALDASYIISGPKSQMKNSVKASLSYQF